MWSYNGQTGALGYVNMQRLAGDDDFLVGYATKLKHANSDYPPLEFRVAKINGAGQTLSTKKLSGAGWGEDDVWVRLSNGCVAFPAVWDSAPGALYGNNGADGNAGTERMSNTLRVTVLCDSPL